MAKTRKKIARIPFDDLEEGSWVAMSWRTPGPEGSEIVHTTSGIFKGFERLKTGEYLLVLRVIERVDVTALGARRRRFSLQDRGPLKFSTRGKPELWLWNGKSDPRVKRP